MLKIWCRVRWLFDHFQKFKAFFMYVNSDVSWLFGRLVCWFGHPNSGTQKKLFKFSFFSCTSTKICWISINDFTMSLIISLKFLLNFFEDKYTDKRKTVKWKDVRSKRRDYLRKCFHSSKQVVDHTNIHFFFLDFLMNLLPFIKWHNSLN